MPPRAQVRPERPAPQRSGSRRRSPPAALAALLAVVAAVGLSWALLVAPWQAPDETTHFAYVQGLAESFRLPGGQNRPGISTEQSTADATVGASRGAFYPASSPPSWSPSAYAAFVASERGVHAPSRTDGDGPSSADQNPPLYYLYASVGYLLDHGGTIFGRLYAARLLGVALLLLSTVGAWLLAGEALGGRRLPQLACAAVAGLLPMSSFVSTDVNPDALMIPEWTLALWLGARVINRRARGLDAIALSGVTAAAVLTKATSYALVPPVVLALALGWLRQPRGERVATLPRLAAAGVALASPIIGWLAVAHALGRQGINQIGSSPTRPFRIREFLSYVWQYYLPRLPFMQRSRTTSELPAYVVWIGGGTGSFGWLDVSLPSWLYRAAAVSTGMIGVATIGLVSRLRGSRRLALLAFFALTVIALLGLLHVTEFRVLTAGQEPFLQGRYLLPAVGLAGLAVGLIVSRIPLRGRALACGATLTGLLSLQVIALASVLQAYYL